MDVGLLRLFGWRQRKRGTASMPHRCFINPLLKQELLAQVFPGLEAFLIDENRQTWLVDDCDLMRLAIGACGAEGASAAKCPQRSIFRRLSAKYPDIRRNRRKLVGAGATFRFDAFCRAGSSYGRSCQVGRDRCSDATRAMLRR
jgi:hypothetical protein